VEIEIKLGRGGIVAGELRVETGNVQKQEEGQK